jgi:hypothetical protein
MNDKIDLTGRYVLEKSTGNIIRIIKYNPNGLVNHEIRGLKHYNIHYSDGPHKMHNNYELLPEDYRELEMYPIF